MFAEATDMPRKSPTRAKPALEQLNVRVPADLLRDLEDGHRVLTILARVGGEDLPNYSRSLRRLWRIGLDVVFSKVGVTKRPTTEAEWQALETELLSKTKH